MQILTSRKEDDSFIIIIIIVVDDYYYDDDDDDDDDMLSLGKRIFAVGCLLSIDNWDTITVIIIKYL